MNKLAVITTYYNPTRYKTRRINFEKFKAGIEASGAQLVTIECTFGDEEPELPPSDDVIHVKSNSVVWQKERLLNIAARSLPSEVDAVAWIDADVIFQNKSWVKDTLECLKENAICQLFETCVRLDIDGNVGRIPDTAESFASVMNRLPGAMSAQRYDTHGHTGYAWAMHREIFDELGLYEHAISGSADHFMAHAIFDDYGFCVRTALKQDENQIKHLKEWGDKFFLHTQGEIGVVRGEIKHFWHGELKNRNYFNRMHEITDLGFDPYTDLLIEDGKPIEWAPEIGKEGLKNYFLGYFASRKEDGDDSRFENSNEKNTCQCC